MSSRMIVMVMFCLLAWLACAAFVIAAAYIHYIMKSPQDVTPLVLGAIVSGCGASWLTNEIVITKQN